LQYSVPFKILAGSRTGIRYPVHPYIYYNSELLRDFLLNMYYIVFRVIYVFTLTLQEMVKPRPISGRHLSILQTWFSIT